MWPKELKDFSAKGTVAIISKLQSALRKERKRAQQNHWSYDLNRHSALVNALKNEKHEMIKTSPQKNKVKTYPQGSDRKKRHE